MNTEQQFRNLSSNRKAWIAAMRFGLGPKPGWLNRIGRGPDDALNACLNELANPRPFITEPGLPTYEEACKVGRGVDGNPRAEISRKEIAARFAKHVGPEIGFVERLVLFWSNHFSMSKTDQLVKSTVGQLERNVIRQHVLGKFSDMLKGVIQHPAMISYLNNDVSVGPNSVVARNYHRNNPGKPRLGYNENLAREILELHTMGEGAPYTQSDVTEFAKILTGWKLAAGFKFGFENNSHEPGVFTVLGRTYATPGQQRGLAVLDDLATRPETAEHIAFKLLVHFVTDEPTAGMINHLKRVFINNQNNAGQLKEVAKALLKMKEAWVAPMNRIRPPHLWLVSQIRALGFDFEKTKRMTPKFGAYLSKLNNEPWTWLTPDGFPDEDYAWRSADAIRIRKDVAFQLLKDAEADGSWEVPDHLALARSLSPSLLSGIFARPTVDELVWWQSKDRKSALNLLFMSPEFTYR